MRLDTTPSDTPHAMPSADRAAVMPSTKTVIPTRHVASLLLFFLLLAAAPAAQAQTIIYVDADNASGTENGDDWPTAYTSLQDALADPDANDASASSTEIWIAAGTYFPDDGATVNDGDRAASFTVTGDDDGLEIYGGFDGTDGSGGGAQETRRDQRDPAANQTILSGDIGAAGDASDNSFHVLVFDGGNNIGQNVAENVTEATVLDGVTVTGGNANGSDLDTRGGGLYCDGADLGNECSPTLRQVAFDGNSASVIRGSLGITTGAGGAIINAGINGGVSSPAITGATFTGNSAGRDGGAIYNDGRNGESSPVIKNATFTRNSTSDGRGGAISNDGSDGVSSPAITNATFTGNSAGRDGGAIFNNGRNGESRPMIANTILFGNTASGSANQIDDLDASPQVTFSLVQGGCPPSATCSDILDADPQFTDADDPAGADGQFATADDGLTLTGGSPALDAGSNDALPADAQDLDGDGDTSEPLPLDITGGERVVQNDSGASAAMVDLGAYEAPSSTTIPVELAAFSATPDGPGEVRLTWQTATEENNDRFEVERRTGTSATGATATATWAGVGRVETKADGGNSSEALRYTLTDADLPFEATALTYRLVQFDRDGTRTVAGEQTVEIGAPQRFRLHGAFPNPVRTQTTIRYELPEARAVTVAVYDALGRKVRTLVDGERQQGRQQVPFATEGLSSGVYFYRITAGGYTEARQLVLVR